MLGHDAKMLYIVHLSSGEPCKVAVFYFFNFFNFLIFFILQMKKGVFREVVSRENAYQTQIHWTPNPIISSLVHCFIGSFSLVTQPICIIFPLEAKYCSDNGVGTGAGAGGAVLRWFASFSLHYLDCFMLLP